jgi:hypothetical protein
MEKARRRSAMDFMLPNVFEKVDIAHIPQVALRT